MESKEEISPDRTDEKTTLNVVGAETANAETTGGREGSPKSPQVSNKGAVVLNMDAQATLENRNSSNVD